MFSLSFTSGAYSALRGRLLNSRSGREQAAFVFFGNEELSTPGLLTVQHVEVLQDRDFVAQRADYLEVADEVRARIIKAAHDANCGIAEFHSHPFNAPAVFSNADYIGLQQTVPHMLWRLKQRPYVAAVVGPRDFDGLVWIPDGSVHQLSRIVEDGKEYPATRRSLTLWQ